jgi:hypothetical protein
VDVRDADLSSNPEVLVQFIELAVLPVAAGLEGLGSSMKRNRLKIVFPTVQQLLEYRHSMTLTAPEVLTLTTLGFDPIEEQDNLVVLIAPRPDDAEGLALMEELLLPAAPPERPIVQPIVVVNHHMTPISGPAAAFEVAYHLRLLTVQYISNEINNENSEQVQSVEPRNVSSTIASTTTPAASELKSNSPTENMTSALYFVDHLIPTPIVYNDFDDIEMNVSNVNFSRDTSTNAQHKGDYVKDDVNTNNDNDDSLLTAAMQHAHELGLRGITRAMVIRVYPNPWHVFVDTASGSDADFEVAATFDAEPTAEMINRAIVECLEGSEREDELVAQQMQQALEAGQLDRVSDFLDDLSLAFDDEGDDGNDDDDDDGFYDSLGTESV